MPSGSPAPISALQHAHAVCFYDHDQELVDLLAEHVAEGLALGERVIVVGTGPHVTALDATLRSRGVDPDRARARGRYLTADATSTLATFMVDGSPDPTKFERHVGSVVTGALYDGPVRVFGEMVGVLWARGNVTGALELEQLWNELQEDTAFTLLCAYPIADLGEAALDDISTVCTMHAVVQPPLSYASGRDAGQDGTEHSRVFIPVPQSVSAVRRFVSRVLGNWHEQDLIPDAMIVASELATNAVTHAASPFRVSVDRAVGVVCIAIQDVGTGAAATRIPSGTNDDGRGMAIVEALSRRWGSDSLPGGKVVWAELAVTRDDRTEVTELPT